MTSLRSRILHTTLQRVINAMDLDLPLQEQRARLNEIARLSVRIPKSVTVHAVELNGLYAEWIEPPGGNTKNTVLYLHGGGYCVCSPDTHRGLAARLSLASDARVLLIDYRLAPEHPFPAALDDALGAYHWLLERDLPPDNIVIAGDSAGCGLTLACALNLRDQHLPLPAAMVCLSPWTDLTFSGESIHTLVDIDPVLKLDKTSISKSIASYYTGPHNPAEPLISPLFADLSGLPPLLIHVGSDEILLSDSTRLVEKARSAGVEVTLKVWKDMWHVFQVFAPYVPEAQRSIDLIGEFVKSHTGNQVERI